VLYASDIPALLVEVGFISHPQEERLLSSTSYQHVVARAIAQGIKDYFNFA